MLVESFGFSQLHIDVARFATDDFNLFHDPHKWQRLHGNPFGGPIVLGFQTETWLAEALADYRRAYDDPAMLEGLRFSNYQVNFAAALKPGQRFSLSIKPSQWDQTHQVLSNRVVLRSDHGIVLVGHHKLSRRPLILPDCCLNHLPELTTCPDRCMLAGDYFLKRKFMMTANAKNFLVGSLIEPIRYFDELEGQVQFPELFPVSYISCALLERARYCGHDFERAPMVYTRHEISIDRKRVAEILSNDCLHILIALNSADGGRVWFRCLGLIGRDVLFRAMVELMPLGSHR